MQTNLTNRKFCHTIKTNENERESCKMNENVIKAALLGFGTVGTGVYKVLKNQKRKCRPRLAVKLR